MRSRLLEYITYERREGMNRSCVNITGNIAKGLGILKVHSRIFELLCVKKTFRLGQFGSTSEEDWGRQRQLQWLSRELQSEYQCHLNTSESERWNILFSLFYFFFFFSFFTAAAQRSTNRKRPHCSATLQGVANWPDFVWFFSDIYIICIFL